MGWMWPSILVPIGVFFIGAVLMSIIITGDALDIKNNNKQ
jgi:uncharacterized integral membrane protein